MAERPERDATPGEAFDIGYTVGHIEGYRDGVRDTKFNDPDFPDDTLQRLLAMGVPWHLATEAIASTSLDRDEDDGGAHTGRGPDRG